MDKYRCIIWGTGLCDGEGARRELLAGINDPSAETIYKKYKERGLENIFFLKYGIECGYSPHVREIKDNQFEVYNPQAGGLYRATYRQFLMRLYSKSPPNGASFSEEEKICLSAYIAKENLSGRIPDLDKEKLLENLPSIPDDPTIRAGLLLKGLVTLYPKVGKVISLNVNKVSHQKNNPTPFLYVLSYSSNSEEFQFLVKSLTQSKDIEISSYKSGIVEVSYFKGPLSTSSQRDQLFNQFNDRVKAGDFTGINIESVGVVITPKGWRRVNNIENKTVKENSKTAFIAMWFDPSMDDLKEEIKKGIEQAGYVPLRIDEKEYNNKIDDEILSDIDQSRFVICDLTSESGKPRGNVYFEAGYAKKAKGNEFIIWTCNERLKDEIAFDVGGYNFIFWYRDEQGNLWTQDGNEKIPLKDKIQKRIESVLYKHKKPEKGVQKYEENRI